MTDTPRPSLIRREWPMLLVLAGVAVALGIMTTGHWRKGAFAFGFAIAVGGVLRLMLPGQLAGWLAVRRRWFDVAILLGAGLVIMALTLIVPHSKPGG